MKKLTLASLSILAAVALVTAGCGADTATNSKAAARTSPTPACPVSWRPGWQRVADRIKAPVYCPSWMPNPLDARIHGVWSSAYSVSRDGSYLIGFAWQENGE